MISKWDRWDRNGLWLICEVRLKLKECRTTIFKGGPERESMSMCVLSKRLSKFSWIRRVTEKPL